MSESLFIRKATLNDLPALTKMSAALIRSDAHFDNPLTDRWSYEKDGQEYLMKRIRGRNGTCLVAEIEGKIVGYITGALLPTEKWRPVSRAELDNLYVYDTYRSKKVGASLLEAFIAWSKRKNVDRVMLHAVANNDRAISFYQRNNFTPQHLIFEKILKK